MNMKLFLHQCLAIISFFFILGGCATQEQKENAFTDEQTEKNFVDYVILETTILQSEGDKGKGFLYKPKKRATCGPLILEEFNFIIRDLPKTGTPWDGEIDAHVQLYNDSRHAKFLANVYIKWELFLGPGIDFPIYRVTSDRIANGDRHKIEPRGPYEPINDKQMRVDELLKQNPKATVYLTCGRLDD